MSAINKINVDNVSYNIEDSRVDNIADSIPTASTEQKGLVQVGQGINVDENGVISVDGSGDTVSYTDGGTPATAVIGTLNINGTDYEIKAPWMQYQDNIGDRDSHTVLGIIDNGFGSQFDINAPAVSYTDYEQGTNALGIINVGGNQYPITYTPAASGDSVQFNSLLASGTQIGTITINGVDTAIYAPAGGSGGGSSVSYQDLTIASDPRVAVGMITIDGAGYNIYVPTTVAVDWNDITGIPDDITKSLSVTPARASGTKIADISWSDNEQGDRTAELYVPEVTYTNVSGMDNTNVIGTLSVGNTNTNVRAPAAVNSLTKRDLNYQPDSSVQISAIDYTTTNGSSGTLTIRAPLTSYSQEAQGTTLIGTFKDGIGNETNIYGPDYSTVATTGSYNDLTNKPTIPTVTVTQTLASGTKIGEIDVSGTTTELFAPAGGSSAVDWADITNKPSIYAGSGTNAIKEGDTSNIAYGGYSHAEGVSTQATGTYSHAEGVNSRATGSSSHAEGYGAQATGPNAHAEGMQSVASGAGAHAEGNYTQAMSENQHTQGKCNIVDANGVFADIVGNGADGQNLSNAAALDWNGNQYLSGDLYVGCIDYTTTDVGGGELNTEHAGGIRVVTQADIDSIDTGVVSMAVTPDLSSGTKIATISWTDGSGANSQDIYAPQGGSTQVQSDWNIISSSNTAFINNKPAIKKMNDTYPTAVRIGDTSQSQATANYATTIGEELQAYSHHQTVLGRYNVSDTSSRFEFIVGNGNNTNQRQNALALGWGGKLYLSGDAYVNCSDYTGTAEGLNTANCGGTKVATLSDIKGDWAITDASASGYIANKPAIKAGTGTDSIVEGSASNVASGAYAHAEGINTKAYGEASHAEGTGSIAGVNGESYSRYSHAEGDRTKALGSYAHSEGTLTEATGNGSHTEGFYTQAAGDYSHAEGNYSYADRQYSHVEGQYVIARSNKQHAQGQANVIDENGVFADIVGNGSNSSNRSNAEATDWNGNKYLSGGIYVGCTDYTTTANGLTTLGAGGFRIDMANDDAVIDPTDAGETISEDYVMIDTVTKEMGYEEQEDPDNPGETIQVPTTVTTTHQRSWQPFHAAYGAEELARDITQLYSQTPDNWDEYGIWQLQIWGIKRWSDDGEGNYTEYYSPEFRWVQTSETTPEDDTDPTEEEPTE